MARLEPAGVGRGVEVKRMLTAHRSDDDWAADLAAVIAVDDHVVAAITLAELWAESSWPMSVIERIALRSWTARPDHRCHCLLVRA